MISYFICFRVYPEKTPIIELKHCAVPQRVPYKEVLSGDYTFSTCSIGESYGPV